MIFEPVAAQLSSCSKAAVLESEYSEDGMVAD